MNEIKSLADQLREKLRTGETDNSLSTAKNKDPLPPIEKKPKKPPKPSPDGERANAFFQSIGEFRIEGTEKSLIRVDKRTMNLLKRIKLAKGVDMNRFIVYCLHQYIAQHPWLPGHIHETLKNTEP